MIAGQFERIEWPGGTLSYGRDDDGDLFVSLATEDAAEGVNDRDGIPRLFVYVNDATVYDPRTLGLTLESDNERGTT